METHVKVLAAFHLVFGALADAERLSAILLAGVPFFQYEHRSSC